MKVAKVQEELATLSLLDVPVVKSLHTVFSHQVEFEKMLAERFHRPAFLPAIARLSQDPDTLAAAGRLRTKHTREFIDAGHNELEELREMTPWKHWREYTDADYASMCDPDVVAEVQYELADMLHFLVTLCLIWGMNADDLLRRYAEKQAVNRRRQSSGY